MSNMQTNINVFSLQMWLLFTLVISRYIVTFINLIQIAVKENVSVLKLLFFFLFISVSFTNYKQLFPHSFQYPKFELVYLLVTVGCMDVLVLPLPVFILK